MKALLIYDSEPAEMIAEAIAEGLGAKVDCLLCTVDELPELRNAGYDVIVVGGIAGGSARLIRGWSFRAGLARAIVTAAYDIRKHDARGRPGSTALVMTASLRRLGAAAVARPRTFSLNSQQLLDPAEVSRAREWGTTLAVLAGAQPLEAVAGPRPDA